MDKDRHDMTLELLASSLLISLIAEAFVALLSHGLEEASQAIQLRKDLRNSVKSDKILAKGIRTVLAKVSRDRRFLPSDPRYNLTATRLRQFLQSPTAESIVRQIFSDSMSAPKKRKSTPDLLEEFKICLAYYLGLSKENVEEFGADLFDVIYLGCTRLLGRLTSENLLAAHEALSEARQRTILDELHAIRGNLDLLTSGDLPDLTSILEFEKKYREQVGDRCRQVTVPHFDRAPRINIDKIFVPPSFSTSELRSLSDNSETIRLEDFLVRIYRTVLLGDPGSGKSTLAQKMCHELFENYDGRIVANRTLTPVLIVLRDFATKKKKEGSSMIQFIESEVTSKYQMPQKPPGRALEYLLHNGHLLVIFDGLDELLDATHRQGMVEDIESFCNLFPSTPVLVTSRVVGYEKAPLDSSIFEIYRIAPFDTEQVEDYAKKWFGIDPDFSPQEQHQNAQSFLRESQIASDLRSNPLMLALMCNLYRGAGYIPHNRPEVYRKCAEMLFERWDRNRGLWVERAALDLRNLLGHLAYWIYSNERRQGGVTEEELIKESTRLLYPSRFETKEEAEAASREFIEFCRGRAWVFTDVGTTAHAQFLYTFTHKTFLEYFTATDVVRKNSTPEKLWSLLSPKIANSEWDVVAQLAFQMLHEQVDSASDDLLKLLLHAADKADNESIRWSFLWFGGRCLQFIAPSPRSVRALTESCLKVILETRHAGVETITSENRFLVGPTALMKALMVAVQECRSTITDCFKNTVVSHARNLNDKVALPALDLALSLPYPLESSSESYRSWEEWKAKIAETKEVNERLEELAHNHYLAFLHWFYRYPDKSIEALPEWYTLDHLYVRPTSLVYSEFRQRSIADFIIAQAVNFDRPVSVSIAPRLMIAREVAAKVGRIIMNTPMPCFSKVEPLDGFEHRASEEGSVPDSEGSITVPVTGEAFFGLCCIVLASVEGIVYGHDVVSDYIVPMRRLGPILSSIASMVQTRKNFGVGAEEVTPELGRFNLSPSAQEFLMQWVTTSRFRLCAKGNDSPTADN